MSSEYTISHNKSNDGLNKKNNKQYKKPINKTSTNRRNSSTQ